MLEKGIFLKPFKAFQNTLSYSVLSDDDGFMFNLGEPLTIQWYREGRTATRKEIMDSINSGVPFLKEFAAKDGPKAVANLSQQYSQALNLVL